MTILHSGKGMALVVALMAGFACAPAHAGERRFEPVPQSDSQRVQLLNGSAIITATAKGMSAGASVAPASARRAWLSVSIKNTGNASVALADGAIQVASAGKPLALSLADDNPGRPKADDYVRDKCANASSGSQLNCNIDSFNQRQADRQAGADLIQLAPGQLLARRFELEIPKRAKGTPTTLDVSITAADEKLTFVFVETQ